MSDATSSAYRIQHLLGEENYATWAVKMTDILTDQGLIDYADGTTPKPVHTTNASGEIVDPQGTTATAIKEWEKKDRQALSQIRLRVSDDPLIYITDAASSSAAWNILADTYQPKGVIAIVLLRRKLFRLQCEEGSSVEEHIRTLTNLRQKLAAQNSKLSEEEFSITLLTSLPDSWDTFISGIDTTSLTESSKLVARILEQDRRRKAKPSSDEVALPAHAHKHHHKHSGKFNANITCYGCGRIGHLIGDCRDVKAGKTFTKAEKDKNTRLSKERYSKKHHAHVAESSAPESSPDFAFMAQDTPASIPYGSWIADSGASKHIVKSRDFFQSYMTTENHTVTGFGSVPCLGTGSVAVASHVKTSAYNMTLLDVLHVPNAPYNLISIGRMASSGLSVQFEGDLMHVYSKGPKRQEIMRGKKIGNLYLVNITNAATRSQPPAAPSAASLPNAQPIPPTHVFATGPTHSWDKWHRIFGHISPASVKMLKNNNMVEGMNVDTSSTPSAQCEACIKAKSHILPFPTDSGREYTEIGEMTFTDVWGPSRITGIHGERYYISFTDAKTRRSMSYFMKKRTEVLDKIKDYSAYIKTQTGKTVKAFHSDNAKEYISKDVRDFLASQGTILETTAPYSPQQNGVAERLNRTLIEHARAMLAAHNLPLFLWPEAVAYATYLKNRSPTRALGSRITPDEAFSGKKPNVSTLQEFGTPIEVLQQDGKNAKIAKKTKPFIFTGLSDESQAWRYYNPDTRRILTSRNVTFINNPITSSSEVPLPPPELKGEIDTSDELQVTPEEVPEIHTPTPAPELANPAPTKRQQPARDAKRPTDYKKLGNPDAKPAGTAMVANIDPIASDPLTVQEAQLRTDWPEWKKAMDEEMAQLQKLGTFSLAPLPSDRTAVSNKWVFRVKRDENGTITRYKARLVAKGFLQIPGIDYDETFAPVVRIETLRLLLAIAAHYNLEIHVVDVIGAYLNGTLDEEIYMQQPEFYHNGTTHVCKLHKAIYGLKQSGRVWNIELNQSFLKRGYTRLLSDQCVYIKRAENNITIIAVHVDDMTIFASNSTLMHTAEKELESMFSVKKLGTIRQILGIEITRQTDGSIFLSQTQYITKILERFQMQNANSVSTPMDSHVKLIKTPDSESYPDVKHIYQNMVGSLMYAAIASRPDISFAVQTLSQFNLNPGPTHLTAVKRVFRYLRGTANLGIKYHSNRHTAVELFSDADWGNSPDDRRSITGYLSTYSGGVVTWNSKKQPTTALSSMEAEYMALASAVREALWLRSILHEIGILPNLPTHISVDNHGTISFASNSGFHARSKHIDIRHHFIREKLTSHEVSVSYCPTAENTADVFTKALDKSKHEYLVSRLGMTRA